MAPPEPAPYYARSGFTKQDLTALKNVVIPAMRLKIFKVGVSGGALLGIGYYTYFRYVSRVKTML